MPVIGFEEMIYARIKSDDRDNMNIIIANNQDKYFNESHFIRCAILKLIREEKKELRNKKTMLSSEEIHKVFKGGSKKINDLMEEKEHDKRTNGKSGKGRR